MVAFKPSSSEDFSAASVLAQDTDVPLNIDYDAQVANQDEHFDEFVAYRERTDIESRTSILAREQAQPGAINWRAQDPVGEVQAPNPHDGT